MNGCTQKSLFLNSFKPFHSNMKAARLRVIPNSQAAHVTHENVLTKASNYTPNTVLYPIHSLDLKDVESSLLKQVTYSGVKYTHTQKE